MRYVSGRYTVARILADLDAYELALTNRVLQGGAMSAAEVYEFDARIQDMSEGKNAVLRGTAGVPSVMVRFNPMAGDELIADGGVQVHPAFIVAGNVKPEIFIGKYQSKTINISGTNYSASLRGVDPTAEITWTNADTYAGNNGPGWHMITNPESAFLALLCRKRGFEPRGNNAYGVSAEVPSEKGKLSFTYDDSGTRRKGRVLTGSGPMSWRHDGTPFGVSDLNGNVWEWNRGLRTIAGEPQVIQDNNAADKTIDHGAASALWKAIQASDGALITPTGTGTTPGSLKWNRDTVNNVWVIGTSFVQQGVSLNNPLWSNTVGDGITVPAIAKLLGLHPLDAGPNPGDGFWLNDVNDETIARRGGAWHSGGLAGVWALNLNNARGHSHIYLGSRLAFCNL